MSEEKKTRKVARSSITGRFVQKAYAKRHPNTTAWDTVPITPREKPSHEQPHGEDGRFIADDAPIEEPSP